MTENVVSFINLERKKCEVGFKYCFDVSSMYMESWDLPSKMAGVSRILAASGSCIDNQEIATSSCQRTTLFFKVTGPELDQLGEQSFDEAYRDAVLPSWGQASWGGWMFPVQMIFKIGMRQTKKKEKREKQKALWSLSLGKKSWEIGVIQNHIGGAWDGCRIHSKPTIMEQGGIQWK